jgi:type IV secretion system protein VirD4
MSTNTTRDKKIYESLWAINQRYEIRHSPALRAQGERYYARLFALVFPNERISVWKRLSVLALTILNFVDRLLGRLLIATLLFALFVIPVIINMGLRTFVIASSLALAIVIASTVIPDRLQKAWWERFWGEPTSAGEFLAHFGAHAADFAERAKTLAIGALWLIGSLVVLSWSVPVLRHAPENGSNLFDNALPLIGSAVGAYFLLAKGVAPIFSALFRGGLDTKSHGQAQFATQRELREAGLIPRLTGIYLGSFLNRKGEPTEEVAYPGRVNLITIGPAGSGKGSGIIVPVLSSSVRSIFIIDPKGEAAAITAQKRLMFGPVHVINPFNVLADDRSFLRSNGFNPLADLKIDDNFTDDCASIAHALVRDTGEGDSAFFAGSARELLTCLIMYEKITHGNAATLGHVRKMLTEPWVVSKESGPLGLALTAAQMVRSDFEPLRSKAGRFLGARNSSMDIISTAINETQFLDSPSMVRDLEGTGFDWQSMKAGPGVTTVYLILPADRLETHANYLRLVVSCALRSLLRSPPGPDTLPVLFMLDELAQLGYMPQIENAMGISRGFGVAMWPFLQDLNQLKALYRDRWQTFIGNAEVLTAFAPGDVFTAEYLSRRCGNKTIIVESESERLSRQDEGRQRGPQGVPLMRPEDLMAMPARQMLCFVKPVAQPFFTVAPPYGEDLYLNTGLNDNPYHTG